MQSSNFYFCRFMLMWDILNAAFDDLKMEVGKIQNNSKHNSRKETSFIVSFSTKTETETDAEISIRFPS